jgi:hypothetical protein
MYQAQISIRNVVLAITAVMTIGMTSVADAQHAGMTGTHDFSAMMPAGCRPEGLEGTYDGTPPTREAMMQKLADEFGLTGQQQQDLQILVMDYAQRLQELATLMRTSGEILATTEPGDPYYWTLTQEFSATASASAGESVILLSELREKIYQVLTAEQRAEFKRRIEEFKAKCTPPVEAESSTD